MLDETEFYMWWNPLIFFFPLHISLVSINLMLFTIKSD